MLNSVNADEIAQSKPCHLDIHHLRRPLLIPRGTERANCDKNIHTSAGELITPIL